MELLNLFDFERAARERIDQVAWDYYASGALDEHALRRNREAFERRTLHYRVLVDVSERHLETRVLDERLSLPVLVAPTAFHRLAHSEGEAATARAAASAGTVMILSTLSNTAVEDVVDASRGPVWFQLYVYRDRSATEALVRRVEAAGCRALVLTVDAPLLGRRERDVRNRFSLPDGLRVENMDAAGLGELPSRAADSGLATYFASKLDPALSWKDVEWLGSLTRLPVIVKGIVRPDDAVRAVEHGARGIVVSNHGGRQLDAAPATLDVLEPIAEAVGHRVDLMLDGGIRRGTDIVKALGLGAKAVLIGRPILWGLAVDGEKGVSRVLEVLRDELDLALALCGCPDVTRIGRDLVSGY